MNYLHKSQWVALARRALLAEEARNKLGNPVSIDVMRPLQAFDAGGRARAAAGIIHALAMAKEAGVDPSQVIALVDWDG